MNIVSLNTLPGTGNKKKKRKARGPGGIGKTAGRGAKGQLSRSGVSAANLIRKTASYVTGLAKIGFTSLQSIKIKKQVLTFKRLSEACLAGKIKPTDAVTKDLLFEKNIIRKCDFAKLVSSDNFGEIKFASIEVDAASASATEELKKLGIKLMLTSKS